MAEGFNTMMQAVEVAVRLLDGDWHIDRRKIQEGSKSYAGWLEIFERTGERISLSCNTYGYDGRIRVTASRGLVVSCETAITVGLDLGGKHLARHINDRFLPDYREAFAEHLKLKRGPVSNEDESTRNLELIKRILSAEPSRYNDAYEFKNGNVRQIYNGHFRFEIELDIDNACRIAAFINDMNTKAQK